MDEEMITHRLQEEIIRFENNAGSAETAKDLWLLVNQYIEVIQSIASAPDPGIRFRNLFALLDYLEAAARELARNK